MKLNTLEKERLEFPDIGASKWIGTPKRVTIVFGGVGTGKSGYAQKQGARSLRSDVHTMTPFGFYHNLSQALDHSEKILIEGYDMSNAKINKLLKKIAAVGFDLYVTTQHKIDISNFIKGPYNLVQTGYPEFDHISYSQVAGGIKALLNETAI